MRPVSGSKSYRAAAVGLALIENGWRVLSLDDLAYVAKNQAET